MADPFQCLATPVIVESGTSLAWSAVAVDSAAATQALSGTASLTAGTYSDTGFINHCAKQMRASVFAAITAAAWFTTKPANAAAIPFKIGVQDTIEPGVGNNPLRIRCASTGGALHSGNATSWQSFSLVNTNGFWGLLGLARLAETRALSIAAGGFDDTGRYQPRNMFYFKSYFLDSGDQRRWAGHTSEVLDDGTYYNYDFGVDGYDRDLVLVTQPQHIVGPQWGVGFFSAFGAIRNLLQLVTVDETLFTGISNSYKNLTYLQTPAYLKSGRWWSRYRQESPTDTLEVFDAFPSSITPEVGEPIQVIPESEAFIEELRRTGLCIRHDPIDETGLTSWYGKAYALRTGANPRPVKKGNGNLFYSVELPLQLVPNPGFATP